MDFTTKDIMYILLDNLYTSPELLRLLFMHHTDAYGTLRKKAGLPTDFWQWKPVKEVGAQPMVKFCEELMVCRWSDSYKIDTKKIVSMFIYLFIYLSLFYVGIYIQSHYKWTIYAEPSIKSYQ